MVFVPRKPLDGSQAQAAPAQSLTTTAQAPARRGRPSGYTDAIAAAICVELASGKSLIDICAEPGMPSRTAVYEWLDKVEEFAVRYARAREIQADHHADELIALAREARDMSHEGIQAVRLEMDARKWVAAKLRPGRYGDKTSVEHSGSVSLEHMVAGSQLIDAEYVDVTPETP